MNLLVAFIVLTLVALAQAALFNITGLKKISYQRSLSRSSAFAGDEIKMVEVIANNKIIPVPWLRVESRMNRALKFHGQQDLMIQEDLYHRSVFFMWGFRRIRRTHSITCVRRGYYRLETIAMTCGDVLGLYSISKTVPVSIRLSVYPALLDIRDMPTPSKRLMGDILTRRWILPDPYLMNGIRQYCQGDPVKDIHWKATAKTVGLQVKTHDYTASPKLLILLNIDASEDQWGNVSSEYEQYLEYGISLAATMAGWASHNGLDAGFGSNSRIGDGKENDSVLIMPEGGRTGFINMLEHLARLELRRKITFHGYLEGLIKMEPSSMDILIISLYDSARLQEQAGRLRKLGNSVTVQMIGGVA